MKKILISLVLIIVFVASGLVSYYLFSKQSSSASLSNPTPGTTSATFGNNYQALTFDPNAPKTQVCPTNGAMYSVAEQNWWEKHRPLGIMIENEIDARPQSGISFADITYEAVAEGGITRTLNIYYCQDAGIVGPVRSARTYFLDYISEYGNNPLYAHVGGANTPGPADALAQIDSYGWTDYNDLNQFAIGFPTYWRDETRQGHPVATEHTMYSTTSKLWAVGAQRGLTNVDKNGTSWDTTFTQYEFKNDAPLADRPMSQKIDVPFWGGSDYEVDWVYNRQQNLYLRYNGGVAHIDRNTGKQLTARDIIVLFETQTQANDGYPNNEHLLYGDTGTGDALVFMDGKEINATWKKDDRTSRTLLYDGDGNEIQFNRGHLWFEIEPTGTQITVS